MAPLDACWIFLLRVARSVSLGVAVWAGSLALAAAGTPRSFDIPAGDAVTTLKRFSQQADVQVIYLVDLVAGEKTQPVRGEFTPSQALSLMLAGSGLAVVEDTQTGALSLKRETPRLRWMPWRRPVARPALPEPERGPAAPKIAEDSAIVLSPFEVNGGRDRGFAAASAFAGGRLAIDLKDSPVSYSVLNRDLLDALQINSLEEAADWAPNSTRVPDHGHESTFGGAVLVAIRGVPGFFAQRDFFPMEFDFDSYNLERFDYGRGPNAVMFGFAPFSGTQNVVTKRARLDRDFGEVRTSLGSWQNWRSTFDFNYRVNGAAALRLNVLDQRRRGWRELEEERKRAVHLAATVKLAPRTELRGEVESGRFTSNIPYGSGYYDGILGWDGVSIYTARQNTPPDAVARGVTSYGSLATHGHAFVYSPSQNASQVIDLMGTGRTTTAQSGGSVGGARVLGPANSFAGIPLSGVSNVAPDRYDLAMRGSQFLPPGITHSYGLTEEPFAKRDYSIASLFLTHALGDLYLEGAVNWSRNERQAMMTAHNGTTAYIDINQALPDGRPNPFFLQPYTQGPMRQLLDTWEKENARFSAAYVLDRSPLGSLVFQGMVGGYRSRRHYLYNVFVAQRHADPANWARTSEVIEYRQYWNHAKTFRPPATVTFVDPAGNPQTAAAGWISDQRERGPLFRDTRQTAFAQASVRGRWLRDRLIGIASMREDRLDRRTWRNIASRDLVGTGWNATDRRWLPLTDRETWTHLTYVPKDASGQPTGPEQPAIRRPRDAQGFALPQHRTDRFQDDFSGFPIEARVRSAFFGLVYHLDPRASLAASYSEGSDFNDAPNRWDGSVFGQKSSRGVDVSLRSSFWGGRLNTALTYYRGREENQGFSEELGAPWASFNTIIRANRLGDLSENGINARGFPLLTAAGWDSRATENRGFEFEAVANPSPAWRVLFNAAAPRAVQTDNSPDFRAYFERNAPTLRAILADAGVLVDPLGQASLDPAVSTALRAPNNEHQNAANAWNLIATAYRNVVTDGQEVRRLPKLTANIFADYTFADGPLKGFLVGAGVNYRGRQVVGYRGSDTIPDPANPLAAIDDPRVGPHDSVYARPYYKALVELGYSWRLRSELALSVRLKVENVFDWDRPIYIATAMLPPGGSAATPARVATPSLFWRMPPRNYTLSLTARF